MNDGLLYEVRDLWKSFSSGSEFVEVLRGVDFKVRKGETVAVRGPSGVGKSTLLHILGLLEKAGKGELKLNGVSAMTLGDHERSRIRNQNIGFVFQFFQLLPEFTALENVIMPGLIAGSPMEELKKRGKELLQEVGLAHRHSHRPGELSGGEQQRVAIARALIMNPEAVLADEPTGNLDSKTAGEVESLLKELNKNHYTTLIVVTHKESLSRSMDRRVGLEAGKLVELG
jgi:lipoprotein-releasing system ATP-binding protein